MARNWIVVGDATTGGGRVITGSPHTDIDGIPVARVNDKVTCPQHKGVFPIIQGDASMIIDGQPVAINGGAVACGCRLMSFRQNHVYVDSAGSPGTNSSTAAALGALAATASANINKSSGGYDQAIRFVTESNGSLCKVGYALRLANGEVIEGVTDDEGLTQRVVTATPVAIKSVELKQFEKNAGCCGDLVSGQEDDVEAEIFDLDGVITTSSYLGTSVVVAKAPHHERDLTHDEIEMARLVFAESIDYTRVKVHNHGYWLFFGLQDSETAVTPNGEMYFPKGVYKDDYSLEDFKTQAWFIHEMAHVWQYQLGYPVKLVRGPRPNMSYKYTLAPDKKLCDYNMEAQGNIIADYFLSEFRLAQDSVYEARYSFDPLFLGMIRATLSDFLEAPSSVSNLPNTAKSGR
ncbi:PAAR domain-containing protein [Stenotrophomonas sp. SY1]|uniref:PAAR domain-containing protein n=1 Tax=Stenotrophomonas sp. SY1 TaxID=477235 RepID=UPI001E3C3288|nr:PAAR domain-containing protein [Stenotrophomonas sp. SY1]MCD9088272.1 PAAR domain-containing protein [Stenotrophomonas sp. SY1]